MQSLVEVVQVLILEGIVDTYLLKIGFDQSKAKDFAKRWSEIPSQYKRGINILGIKTPQEVEDTLKRLESKWAESKTGKEKAVKRHGIQGLVYGEDYIELDTGHPDIIAYAPQNHKASQLIASTRIGPCEGKWCTATNNPKHWNDYTEQGIKLIYIITPDTKYAVAATIDPHGSGRVSEIFTDKDKPITELPKPINLKKLLGQIHLIKIKLSTRNEISRIIANNPYADLNHLDISDITDMSELFKDTVFNGDISKWDVSHVTSMRYMFQKSLFKGDISKWNTSNVTDMSAMFARSAFNGDISRWNTSNVTDMSYMFLDSRFKGDISKWDVSKVTNMGSMFYSSHFNGDISRWNVSNVTTMFNMFGSTSFTNNISRWDVSNVKDMGSMFANSAFNGDISGWDVSRVTDMSWMFTYSKFRGDISKWDVSNVATMNNMFEGSSFDGDISKWNVHIYHAKNMRGMFRGTKLEHTPPSWYKE